jgi:histidinol dehydrogenase
VTLDIAQVELAALSPSERTSITRRSATPDAAVVARAAEIVEAVAAGGDEALRAFSAQFGGSGPDGSTRISMEELEKAAADLAPHLETALRMAIENVRTVHEPQRPLDDAICPVPGVTVGRRWAPLRSVGVYVPGGRALYPSSLIMGVVPAIVADVERIVVATPARADGLVDPVVLATAHLLGVTEVHAMGGAHAVAALAHGTETIDPVDKIVGPGGPWVTAAKLVVSGRCGVDLPAGPSEAAVLADATADPRVVAADVMCQAEHGDESAVVLVVTDQQLIEPVIAEIDRMLDILDRSDTIRRALTRHGLVVTATDHDDAVRFVDEWAPEHLSIHTAHAEADADRIPAAGSVFVGHWTPEAAGDYATGANHVLPTGGLARAYGPLGVEDFGSWRQVQHLDRSGLEALAPTIDALARAEGLTAHAYAVTARLDGGS